MPQRPLSATLSRLRVLLGTVLSMGLVLGVGCATQGSYEMREGEIASRYLPPTRSVDHHPDSLEALSVRIEDDSSVSYELDGSYESLWRKWSSAYRNLGAGGDQRTLSYATFWSLELSLASLQAEVGIDGLTAGRAQKILEKRRQAYQKSIQVDVYWFEAEGNSVLAGAGTRVRLRVDDEEYKPRKEDFGPLREAFLSGGRTGLYRRNTFHFARTVNGEDILRGTDSVALLVDFGANRVRFRWEWPKP